MHTKMFKDNDSGLLGEETDHNQLGGLLPTPFFLYEMSAELAAKVQVLSKVLPIERPELQGPLIAALRPHRRKSRKNHDFAAPTVALTLMGMVRDIRASPGAMARHMSTLQPPDTDLHGHLTPAQQRAH